jgi:hypothetical protein
MVIHGDKLRWLFWLRWKTFLRGFTRSSGRVGQIIGTIFMMLFILVFIGSIAVGSFFAYRFLPAPVNTEILFLVLTACSVIWLVLPLMEFTINEGLDLSKLALFPLTRAELMISLLFSTLLDVPTLGLLLVFAAVIVGWGTSLPLVLFTLLTMLIFYVQVVSLSQLVLALLTRFLQSRRFRDLRIVLVVLLSFSGYLCNLASRGLANRNVYNALENGAYSSYLQWLPPGMAARSIQLAVAGNWGMSFVWLGALLVIGLVLLYCWQLVVERGLSAPESGGTVKSIRPHSLAPATDTEHPAAPASTPVSLWSRFVSPQLTALLIKDLKYYRRDPQMAMVVISALVSPIFLMFVTLFSSSDANRLTFLGPWTVMVVPFYVFFSVITVAYNTLGLERQGLTTLFLFPVEPKRILWAKNIVSFGLGFIPMLIFVSLAAFLTHAWEFFLPALAVGLAGIGVILGCGNFTSVFFPQRVRAMGRGLQTSASTTSQAGCLRGLLSILSLIVTAIILIPVALALVAPAFFHVQWVWFFSVPASLAYGAAIYAVITTLVAPRILNKAPEILAIVTRE